ncbi:hypothetical protein CFC21_082657 [Triticum aestivum]|uniref:Uncharacterized protein n=3 Tax=Triticum TaxID=4564 RepID=A0A9R0XWW5_TRITD|nr:hypothetical protein CFC21_082657 [Triticum aestivum]VAI43971.1 unnamed protein product [Triticum turgidum subsp. durum]
MVTAFRAGIGAWPMERSPNVHPRFREVIQVSKKVRSDVIGDSCEVALFDSGAIRPWQPCGIYA